jgi:prolyl oligopeptidase
MRSVLTAVLALALVVPAIAADAPLAYPPAPRGTVTDTFFGTPVPDPYRWLEQIDSPETTAWVKAEGALTRGYLDAIPVRPAIATSYRKLMNYPYSSSPFREGTHWFFYHNRGLQTQSPLYVRDSETGPARLFFDPNTLSKDGSTQLDRTSLSFTTDGSLMAYATQTGGSDWQTWHVKSVATGRDLPDRIAWSKYASAAWVGNRGFYYEGFDAPRGGNTTFAKLGAHKVWFHRLGTPQSADRVVATSAAHPDQFLSVQVTDDDRYVLLESEQGIGNSIAWKRTSEPDTAFRPIIALDPNVQYNVIANDGPRIYVWTNLHAPRFRVAALDLTDPKHALHDVLAQTGDKLEGATIVRRSIVASYLHDAHSVLKVAGLDGGFTQTVSLPGIGSASVAATKRDDRAFYFTYQSYAYPPVHIRYDLGSATARIVDHTAIGFDAAAFVTEQIFATSKDGTRVPIFVTHRRDMPLDGTTPTILYGYGGFDISWTPGFWTQNAMWLKMGGAYAVVTLRGGGEYGEAWHDAGKLLQKQHVFDDYLAAAQLLIDRKITSTPKLAANGGSNGGLLVGAAITQRPDLFGAAVAEEGVLDMLRYAQFTVGKAWIPEYGDPQSSDAMFRALYAYSPVHNVRDGTPYPPTLVMTADHDDRVFPAHSYKFVAALQHAQMGPNPILLRVQLNEGHFAGLTTEQSVALGADFYAFLAQELNFTPTL